MSEQVPKTMRALIRDEKPSIQKIPVPTLGDNEGLVKVLYHAQNPTDWKHAAFLSPPNAIAGCDFSGTVIALGKNLKTPLEIGDKVAGPVHGGLYPDRGSCAEYLKADSDLVFKVPEGVSMEEAPTFGIGWGTACQALIASQKKPFPGDGSANGQWLSIYGASSSVGLFAVPLAKAMGYRVIAICSPHNFDLVKSYGADEVVDYHDTTKCTADVQSISGDGVELGLDTISTTDSLKVSLGCFGPKGGQLNTILPPSEEIKGLSGNVRLESTLMYTLYGKAFKFGDKQLPAMPDDRVFGAEVYKRTPEIIAKYGIKANPIQMRGGLDDVTAGWEEMKAGKVSGKKLVYKIASE